MHAPRISASQRTMATAITAPVLYVEDNLANLTLVQRVVTRQSQTTLLTAMEGRTGFDLAVEHRPCLILLDLNLPDIQGDELLTRLHDDPRTRTIPIVILSADASPKTIRRLLALGAHEYLTKPLDVARLMAILNTIAS